MSNNYGGGYSGYDDGGGDGILDSLFSGGSSRAGVSAWRSEWSNVRSLQNQLDDQVARAASHQQRVSSQLAKVQGDLSHRVDRLSRAFDAFVELSELRETLVLYTDARRWRLVAKSVIEGAVSNRQLPADVTATGIDDVSGYWLVPAIKALPGILAGRPDAALLGEAISRDELRTATFVSAVAPVLGHPEMVTNWIDRAMHSPDGSVSHAQRVLWLAALDGTLPDGSGSAVRAELQRGLESVDTEARTAAISAAMPATTASRSGSASAGATAAAATIRAWLAWAHELDGTVPLPSVTAQETTGHSDPTPASVPGSTADDLLDIVRSLVEEGSAEERDLLDRAEALQATISDTTPAGGEQWDDPAGTALELLCSDLRETADARRARLAVSLLQADLVQLAGSLLAPSQAPVPTAAVATVLGGSVDVSVEGGDETQVRSLLTRNSVTVKPIASPLVLGAGAVVVIALMVLAVAVSAGFLVLVGIGVVALAVAWFSDRSKAAAASRQNSSATAAVQASVQRVSSQLNEDSAAAERAAADGAAAHRELMTSLAALIG